MKEWVTGHGWKYPSNWHVSTDFVPTHMNCPSRESAAMVRITSIVMMMTRTRVAVVVMIISIAVIVTIELLLN